VTQEYRQRQVDITYATPAVQLSDPDRRALCLGVLSADERERLQRLRPADARDLFLTAHALVRWSLSQRQSIDPAVWQFSADERGRPRIVSPATDLAFTLTHTRGLASCAVVSGEDVGIDAEDVSRQRPRGLAERFFSRRECDDLQALPADTQLWRFFEYWTLKEAYVKASGKRLGAALRSCTFVRDSRNEWRLECDPAIDVDPGRWRFESWRRDDRYQLSLAVSRPPLPETTIDVKHFTGDVTRRR
jgi:4'-phosphopantetheinyl transferase